MCLEGGGKGACSRMATHRRREEQRLPVLPRRHERHDLRDGWRHTQKNASHPNDTQQHTEKGHLVTQQVCVCLGYQAAGYGRGGGLTENVKQAPPAAHGKGAAGVTAYASEGTGARPFLARPPAPAAPPPPLLEAEAWGRGPVKPRAGTAGEGAGAGLSKAHAPLATRPPPAAAPYRRPRALSRSWHP